MVLPQKQISHNGLDPILIVDEDAQHLQKLQEFFQEIGFHSFATNDPEQALDLVTKIPLSMFLFGKGKAADKSLEKCAELQPYVIRIQLPEKQFNKNLLAELVQHAQLSHSLKKTRNPFAGKAPQQIPTLKITTYPNTLDFFEFYQPSEKHLDVAIGHVEGSIIDTLVMRSHLNRYSRQALRMNPKKIWEYDLHSPDEILEELQEIMNQELKLFYGRFDLEKQLFYYNNIGHLPPHHFKSNPLHHHRNLIQYQPQDIFSFHSIQENPLIQIQITDEQLPSEIKTCKFKGDLSQLGTMRDFIQRTCHGCPGDHEALSYQMQLAINEIFCNIVKHGLKNDSHTDIVIQAKLDSEGIYLDIADQGPGFDPKTVNEPSFAGDKESGFGLYLIKKIADEMTYVRKKSKNGWNHLQLFKAYLTKRKNMEITHTLIDEVLVITPKITILDSKEVPDFKTTILDIIENRNPTRTMNIVLNLENIEFIDSSGLGIFLSLLRSLRADGGKLKLANLKRQVYTIFELVSMNKAFEIYNNVNEAVKSF